MARRSTAAETSGTRRGPDPPLHPNAAVTSSKGSIGDGRPIPAGDEIDGGQAMEFQIQSSDGHIAASPLRLAERQLPNKDEPIFDQGLAFDLETLVLDR